MRFSHHDQSLRSCITDIARLIDKLGHSKGFGRSVVTRRQMNGAVSTGNQQIPGAQPYRSPQQSTPSQQLPPIQQLSPDPHMPSPRQPGPRMQLASPRLPLPGILGHTCPGHSFPGSTTAGPTSAGKSILAMPMGLSPSQVELPIICQYQTPVLEPSGIL
jgi:hypothetical protein